MIAELTCLIFGHIYSSGFKMEHERKGESIDVKFCTNCNTVVADL